MFSNKKYLIFLVVLVLLPGVAFGFIGPSPGQDPGDGGGRLIIDSEGNIGFGTSSSTPASDFDATSTDSGPTAHGYVFMVASTTNPGVGLKNLTSGNVWLWSARNFGPLQLYRESTTLPGLVVMEVLDTGHVGIHQRATTTARLKVGGNVESTGSFVGTVSGAVVAGNVSSDVFGRLQGNGNFAFPASLGIATSSESGLPQELSVYGDAYVSGNVGIGTVTPNAPLEIRDDFQGVVGGFASGILHITNKGTDANDNAVITGHNAYNTNKQLWYLGSTTNSNDNIAFINRQSGTLSFSTNNTQRLTIDADGDIGIGTTTPGAKTEIVAVITGASAAASRGLYVNATGSGVAGGATPTALYGKLNAGYTGGATTYGGNFSNSGAGTAWNIGVAGQSTGAGETNIGGYFTASGATNNYAAIFNGGNVGIGTTTPAYALHVYGTGYFTDTVTVGTPTTSGHATTKSYVDSIVGGGSGAGSFATLVVSGTSTLATGGGRVGIGTTSPTKTLDVVGTAQVSGETFFLSSVDFVSGSTSRFRDNVPLYFGTDRHFNLVRPTGTDRLDISYDTTELVTILPAGNVGINTTSPTKLLHIHNPAASGLEGLYIRQLETTEWGIDIDGTTYGLIVRSTGGTALQTLGTGKSIFAGNVGIATTTPAYALHVYGTGAFSQPVIVGTPTGNTHATTKSYVDTAVASAGSAYWNLSGSNLYASSTSWDVGIGTTGPMAKLHVSDGTINTANGTPTSLITAANLALTTEGSIFAIQSTDAQAADLGGSINLGGRGTPTNSVSFAHIAGRKENSTSANYAGYLQFGTSDSASDLHEYMRITSTGNVGIGTTGPEDILDIRASGSGSDTIGDSHLSFGLDNDYWGFRLSATPLADLTLDRLYSSTDYEVMRIQRSSGNVGIATTSPAYALHVYGTGAFSQPVIVGTPTATGHATTKSYVDSAVTGGGSDGSFATLVVSGTSTLATTGGSVGIGTTSPTSKLTISDASPELRLIATDENADGWGILPGATGQHKFGILDRNAATTPFVIDSSGRVGIGTTSPDSLLHVEGTNPDFKISPTGASGLASISLYRTTAGSAEIASGKIETIAGSNAGLKISTSDVSNSPDIIIEAIGDLILQETGNVGIATTTPAYALHVYGTGAFSQPLIVGTPTQTSHATTKSYVDSAVTGGGSDGSFATLVVSGTSTLATTGGNVGIGTVTPNAPLEIRDDFQGVVGGFASGILHITNKGTDANDNAVITGHNAYNTNKQLWYLGSTTNSNDNIAFINRQSGTLSFSTNNTQRLTIDADGDVGIGTTSPGRALEVKKEGGGIRVSGGTYTAAELYDGGTGDPGYLALYYNGTKYFSIGANDTYFNSGNVGIGTTVASSTLTVNGDIAFYGGELIFSDAGTANRDYMSYNDGGITGLNTVGVFHFQADKALGQAVTSPSAGISVAGIYSSSNVGIATTSPAYALHVYGTAGFSQPIIVGTPTGGTHATTKSYVDTAVEGVGSAYWNLSGSDLYASSTSWEVGIGTTSPLNKLHIVDAGSVNIRLSMNENDDAAGYASIISSQYDKSAEPEGYHVIGTYYGSGVNKIYIGGVLNSINAATSINFYTAANETTRTGTQRMIIDSSGDVGIGDTSPDYLLDVGGTSGFGTEGTQLLVSADGYLSDVDDYVTIDDDLNVVGQDIYLNNVKIISDSLSSSYTQFQPQNDTLIIYDGSSAHSLQVYEDGNHYIGLIGSNTNSQLVTAGTNNDMTINASGGDITIGSGDNINLNGDLYVINSSGNVGIATSSPAYALHVYGTGAFTQPVIIGTPTIDTHAATKSYVDSASVSSADSCDADATCEMNGADLNSGNITGVNKLTVTTIDPLYQINGVKYATYVSDTIGLKMETYGKAKLVEADERGWLSSLFSKEDTRGYYEHVIDFNKVKEGSELWLFWQTVKEGRDMEDVIMTLTPEGAQANVWYELKPKSKQIVIRGDKAVSVAYHLVAPRHDADEWPTRINTDERATILKVKQ